MKKLIAIIGFIAVVIFGLRVYGAYRTEQTTAANRAEQARTEATAKDREAAKLKLEYYERAAESRRESAALMHSASNVRELNDALGQSLELSSHDIDIEFASGECSEMAINLRFYAELEGRYSTNRRLQTKAIAHKVWLTLIGSAESNEQWVQFLTTHETDMKGHLL